MNNDQTKALPTHLTADALEMVLEKYPPRFALHVRIRGLNQVVLCGRDRFTGAVHEIALLEIEAD